MPPEKVREIMVDKGFAAGDVLAPQHRAPTEMSDPPKLSKGRMVKLDLGGGREKMDVYKGDAKVGHGDKLDTTDLVA